MHFPLCCVGEMCHCVYCYRKGDNDIIRLLLDSGGRSTLVDTNRRSLTPLGEALVNGHVDSASLLIQQVSGQPWDLARIYSGDSHGLCIGVGMLDTCVGPGLGIILGFPLASLLWRRQAACRISTAMH